MTRTMGSSTLKISENIQQRPITSRRRTGRAFFIDTFEHYTTNVTEKYLDQGSVPPSISLATDYPKTGLNCMKLTTPAIADNVAEAMLIMGAFPKSRFGIEFDFQSAIGVANIRNFTIWLYYYDGTNLASSCIRWRGEANMNWQYGNAAGAMVNVPDGAQNIYVESIIQPHYHSMKLVVDFIQNKYVKLLCDDREFDLSAIPFQVIADATAPQIRAAIWFDAAGAVAVVGRIDNLILTDQEP